MNSKKFYGLILSKGVPLFMLFYGFFFALYCKFVKKTDNVFIRRFIFVFLSLIVIVECMIAFCRTIKLLKGMNAKYSLVIRFRLLILPYLPPILGTLCYGALRVIEYGILYKREFIIVLGTTLVINFTFSVIYNCKVHTVEHIQYSYSKEIMLSDVSIGVSNSSNE